MDSNLRYPPRDWQADLDAREEPFIRFDDHLDDEAIADRLAQIDHGKAPRWSGQEVLDRAVEFVAGVMLSGVLLLVGMALLRR